MIYKETRQNENRRYFQSIVIYCLQSFFLTVSYTLPFKTRLIMQLCSSLPLDEERLHLQLARTFLGVKLQSDLRNEELERKKTKKKGVCVWRNPPTGVAWPVAARDSSNTSFQTQTCSESWSTRHSRSSYWIFVKNIFFAFLQVFSESLTQLNLFDDPKKRDCLTQGPKWRLC